MSDKAALLDIDDVTHRHGALEALRGVSLRVHPGEVVGLLGPNGAGKSTLLALVCGLLPLQVGRITVAEGREPLLHMGFCPQEDRLWPDLTCFEQLTLVATLYDLPRSVARERAASLLAELGLEDKRDAVAGTLSGGMRRRLSLAMALIHDPALLILDEADAGLDPSSRVELRDYLKDLARKRGKGILFATHSLDEVERIADRIVILDRGRVVADGAPCELIAAVGGGARIGFSLRGARDQAALAAELAGLLGQDLVEQHGRFAVEVEDPLAVLARLSHLLDAHGATVADLDVRSADLEHVFMARTGRRYEA
jgi:ABC-2 type transport system ATP-binding protein